MKTVLIVSHERSGTHFLIDSIRKNFRNAIFPAIRPSYSSVENLFLPHDKNVTRKFYDFLFNESSKEGIKLFKTHLLPMEFEIALKNEDYFSDIRDREIVSYLYNYTPKVYIKRDVHDLLVSLFHYMKNGGGLQVAMRERIADISFSEFIRLPNYHIMPCRSFSEIDKNLITYWANHVKQWQKKEVVLITFEELKKNFMDTLNKLAIDLEIRHFLLENISPPDLPIPPDPPKSIVGKAFLRIKNKMSIPKNELSTAVLPRKGIIGDHKTHFSDDDYVFVRESLGLCDHSDIRG